MDVEVEVVKEAPENLKVTVAEEISRYWTAVPRKFPSETQIVRPIVVKPEVTTTSAEAASSSGSSSNNSSSSSIGAGSNKSIGPTASMENATGFLGSLQSNSESSVFGGKSMSTEACISTSCEDGKKPLASVYNESASDTDASLFGLPEERTSGSGSNSSSSSSDTSYQNDASSVDRASTRRKSFFLF